MSDLTQFRDHCRTDRTLFRRLADEADRYLERGVRP